MSIVLDNITVSYRSVPAVHHAFARFEAGSSWAIFGPNGAGKSTLLKAIMRLLPCDTGSVQWQACSGVTWPTCRNRPKLTAACR